jgi:hypothetical protein
VTVLLDVECSGDWGDVDMNAFWIFDCGRLVAYNPTGAPLGTWPAEEAMGPRLADMLNVSPDLSWILLPRVFIAG